MRYINYSIILTLMLLLVLLCESTQGLRFFNFPVCFCFSSKYRQGRKIFEYVIEWSKSRVKIEVTCLDAINTILALEYLKCSEWHHDSDTLSLSGTTWPCCLLEVVWYHHFDWERIPEVLSLLDFRHKPPEEQIFRDKTRWPRWYFN